MTSSLASPSVPGTDRVTEQALRVLMRLLGGFPGNVGLRLWNDTSQRTGKDPPDFTLVLRDPRFVLDLVKAAGPVQWADAYLRGRLDIEGDLYSALALKRHLENVSISWRDKAALLHAAWRWRHAPPLRAKVAVTPPLGDTSSGAFAHRHTRTTDERAIAFHYDVSNDFYALWLDRLMVYSCAYFSSPSDSLDDAQAHKMEHVCRKLRLRPGDRLLDIGCGWGALVCWAAQHHGVHAHGITISKEQHRHAQQRIEAQGLGDRVTVELRDYRDLPGTAVYDRVASIGMLEHVGLANMPTYLATVHRILRPGGLFLNHGITHDEDGWGATTETAFINRYVFPDGEFDRVSHIQLGMEKAGFEIEDVESLRRHYALTLRNWVTRLESHQDQALCEVGESAYRLWRLYMVGCALVFESGETGVYQVLASRRGSDAELPLTRADLYI